MHRNTANLQRLFNWKKLNKQSNAGFTLVELAIVLVIVGLLFGAVLKGQSLIKQAKVKNIVKLADELRAAVNTFYDKYGQFPGDENIADQPLLDVGNGDSDGMMEDGERYLVFNDLMLSDLIAGNYDGTNAPKHPYGDEVYGIYWISPPNYIGTDHFIRFDNLPWDVCLNIDTKYDDGIYDTGSIVANEDYLKTNTPINNFYWLL